MDIIGRTKPEAKQERSPLRIDRFCEFSELVSEAIYQQYRPEDGNLIVLPEGSDLGKLVQMEVMDHYRYVKEMEGFCHYHKTTSYDVVWDGKRECAVAMTL